MNTEIIPANQDSQLAVRDPEAILRFAVEHNASVETIERMMAVRRELRQEAAKEAFDRALADFQSECPIIVKSKDGAKQAYKYAPLDDIVHQTRELIRKHGFSYSITGDFEPGFVQAVCTIKHSAGHSEESRFKAPIDNKNPMMTDPQRYGGAMTFAKRYAFCNAFGILTADEDRDAGDKRDTNAQPIENRCQPQTGKRSAKAEVWSVAGPKFGNEPANFEKWLRDKGLIDSRETLKTITEEQWTKILPHVENAEFQF